MLFRSVSQSRYSLLGDGYDRNLARKNFYPPFLLYLLRFLDIYDKSMEGKTVEEFIIQKQNPKPTPQSNKEKLMRRIGEEILKSFGLKEFWEARYSTLTQNATYDWYCSWSDVSKLIYSQCGAFDVFRKKKAEGKKPESPVVLHLGCGNSTLSEELYDDGITNVHGIDFCNKVIDLMNIRKDRAKKETLRYSTMDARGLRYDDNVLCLFYISFVIFPYTYVLRSLPIN